MCPCAFFLPIYLSFSYESLLFCCPFVSLCFFFPRSFFLCVNIESCSAHVVRIAASVLLIRLTLTLSTSRHAIPCISFPMSFAYSHSVSLPSLLFFPFILSQLVLCALVNSTILYRYIRRQHGRFDYYFGEHDQS